MPNGGGPSMSGRVSDWYRGGMADDTKGLVLKLDPETHRRLRAMADHYGASLQGTIMRYVRDGLEGDEYALRQKRNRRRLGGGAE